VLRAVLVGMLREGERGRWSTGDSAERLAYASADSRHGRGRGPIADEWVFHGESGV